MEPNATTILKKQLAILPPELTSVLASGVVQDVVASIAEFEGLTKEQRFDLENEIGLTLLGLEFVSDFPERVKTTLQLTDESFDPILDKLALMIFTPGILSILKSIEEMATESEAGEQTPNNATPAPTTDKKPEPKPGIVANPPEKVVPKGNVATIKNAEQASVPTGKMVGLKKEETESSIKGMRTMRGDINRLRGPEGEADNSDTLQKPFEGK